MPLSCQKQEDRVPDRGYFILTSKQIMKQFVGLFGCVFFSQHISSLSSNLRFSRRGFEVASFVI